MGFANILCIGLAKKHYQSGYRGLATNNGVVTRHQDESLYGCLKGPVGTSGLVPPPLLVGLSVQDPHVIRPKHPQLVRLFTENTQKL